MFSAGFSVRILFLSSFPCGLVLPTFAGAISSQLHQVIKEAKKGALDDERVLSAVTNHLSTCPHFPHVLAIGEH